jgi:hypothetical protein
MVAQAQIQQGSKWHGSKVVGVETREILVKELDFSFSVGLFKLPVVGGSS